MTPARRSFALAAATATALATAALLTAGCTTTYPNVDPTGAVFPSVVGESLDGVTVAIPEDLAGRPAVLLAGYRQKTQFDIDRWLLGLLQAGVDAQLYEIPTIPGISLPLIPGWIDNGMRSGIPPEDWAAVVTLYGKAAKPVAQLTGTEEGQRARILVLDAEGRIVAFEDEGFSPSKALEIAALVEGLNQQP